MAANWKIGRLEDWKDRPLILPTIPSSIQAYESINPKPLHNRSEAETR